MDEYISRAGIIAEYDRQHQGPPGGARKIMETFPAADVVSRDVFNRMLSENDDMRAMLAQIGKKPGDSMDDVRRAKHGKWIYDCERTMDDGWTYKQRHCSKCGYQTVECDNFCQHCGAIMDA